MNGMDSISIAVIGQGEPSFATCLEAIAAEAGDGVEVVVAHSGTSPEVPKTIQPITQLLNLEASTRALEARFIAAMACKGSNTLLLDSTRVLLPGWRRALSTELSGHDMVVLTEQSPADSYWARAANLDKKITGCPSEIDTSIGKRRGTVLPRAFRSSLLRKALEELRMEIAPIDFKKISYGEHHLIFMQCLQHSSSVAVTSKPMICHIGDSSPIQIVRKYAWYGASQVDLDKLTTFNHLSGLGSHARPISRLSIRELAYIAPLYGIRGGAFFGGKFMGRFGLRLR